MKKNYNVSFNAQMNEADLKAMRKYFYETMEQDMNILVDGLEIKPADNDFECADTITLYEGSYRHDMITGEIQIWDDESIRYDDVASLDIGDVVELDFVDIERHDFYQVVGKTAHSVVFGLYEN